MTKNWIILGIGVLLALFGTLWTLQGLNVMTGSAMSGVTMFAVLGPIVGILGVALVAFGVYRRRKATR